MNLIGHKPKDSSNISDSSHEEDERNRNSITARIILVEASKMKESIESALKIVQHHLIKEGKTQQVGGKVRRNIGRIKAKANGSISSSSPGNGMSAGL